MENKTRNILVPWDFTDKSEFAYAHAVNYSKITGNPIKILHVVKTEREIEPMKVKLDEVAQQLTDQSNVNTSAEVIKGNIFKSISTYASQGHTEIVMMGTHGMKGFQRFTGSWALKVIRGSKVPFLVVQDMPTTDKYKKIVFPIDFKTESIDKIKWGHYICGLYHSQLYIIHPVLKDRVFKKKIYSNVMYTKKYFDNTDILYEIHPIKESKEFAIGAIEFSKQMDADLIIITVSRTITLADYLMGPSEQLFIANEAKIPVMVVNPKPKMLSGGFSATGT